MSTADDNKKVEKKGSSEAAGTAKASTNELVRKYMLTAADVMPAKVKPFIVKAAPFVGKAAEFAEDKVIPFLILYYGKAVILWEKLQPYKPMLLVPSLIGLIMCFFGGTFLTVIAAVEAYRLCGYEQSMECVCMLMTDFQKVLDANKKDDEKDEDNDGVADVLQVSPKDLAVRKTLLFLKTVNPQRITDALAGINSGLMGVVATLKLKFVKTVTLGNSIANNLQIPADKYIVPHLIKLLPPPYQRWAPVLVSYAIKSVAVSVAWTIQRVISAFHAALTGGLMFSRNIMAYLSEMDYYKINADESIIDEVVGYGIAVLGFVFQLRCGFGLPFPLNVILFPVTMLEYFLMGMVTSSNN